MNYVKKERLKLGITQQALAERSGLSLRTIQRVESSNIPPKGFTLKALSDIFEVPTAAFLETYSAAEVVEDADKVALKMINISILAFFIFPFANIFLPILLWSKKRSARFVDEIGRRIISFQIIWTLLMCISLCFAPFIEFDGPISLIFIVLIAAYAINLIVVIRTAHSIQKEKFDFLDLPIKLL